MKHNIRDEWLARHLGQEKPKSMADLTTLMTRFRAERTAGWLAAIIYQRTMVLRIPRIAMVGHVATNTSAASTTTIPRIRQSMPDSKALNLVSGKSHSKEALRARPVWTVYSIARVKYTTPPTSQLTTPTGNVGCSSRSAS